MSLETELLANNLFCRPESLLNVSLHSLMVVSCPLTVTVISDTSWVELPTRNGAMRGSYVFIDHKSGKSFDVPVGRLVLTGAEAEPTAEKPREQTQKATPPRS